MSQPGAGVRRERESYQRDAVRRCARDGHPPDQLIEKHRADGSIARLCGACFMRFSCPTCGLFWRSQNPNPDHACDGHVPPWEPQPEEELP